MKDIIKGKAYVLGNDIDTDQIIPAQHLVYSLSDPEERKQYGRYALSSVPDAQAGLPEGNIRFVNEGNHRSEFNIIIAGKNFGCGSSREHAPEALNIAGVEAVVAESYARIFYRNSVDGGFYIPFETGEHLFTECRTGDEIEIEMKKGTLRNVTTGKVYQLKPLGDVEQILMAGGIFAYARKSGMLSSR
ncbi:MAG: 3-isopropylmalate dehydratase [Nitrospirae bacterium RBG_16_43_11]|nr:MAG: 3-isopropylmalate dehydratase [Nitrospirae bacterium RBG_16_43_11]